MKRKVLFIILLLFVVSLLGCFNVEESDVEIVINPGVDTIEIGDTYTDPGATARAKGFRITSSVVLDTVDESAIGTYEIVYETTYRGFTKQAIRYVRVVDETPPELVLNVGLDTIYEGDTWEDGGIQVIDNSNLEPTITIIGNVSCLLAGEYIITYRATDASGNASEIIRYVNVLKKP